MATKKKLLEAAAGSAGGGAALNVEDVFSTYLYTGTGATLEINNGIDLSSEGGLVWQKVRSSSGYRHFLFDTERTFNKYISSNTTDAESSLSALSSFDSDGVTLTSDGNVNGSGIDSVLWTFRKAPKFFDVQAWSGNSSASRNISHNLGSVPGMIMVKCTSHATDWVVYHRSVGATKYAILNDTAAFGANQYIWNNTTPTDSVFTISDNNALNASGRTYVAYLFAHNDGDGGFGPTGDQDIIKCGTWTGTGSVMDINLGFEPQWIMYKRTDATGDWEVFDNMRGLVVGGSSNSTGQRLIPNRNEAEGTTSPLPVVPTPTGFRNESSFHYTSGRKFIYIAIRRGPMAVPESATDVFAVAARTGTTASGSSSAFVSGFPVDFGFVKRTTGTSTFSSARLIQNRELLLNSTAAEGGATNYTFDSNTGMWGQTTALSDQYAWMWKRAPSFFDVVAYTGLGTAGSHNHNLLATPEMAWFKARNSFQEWIVYHKDLTAGSHLRLNTTHAELTGELTTSFAVSDTQFTFANDFATTNSSSTNYIAYLFASLDGVSKVGSYTGNGSNTGPIVDCGFSGGPRMLIIKRVDAAGPWYIWDTERGLVAGNDAGLLLDDTAAEFSADQVDPTSSGFQLSTDNTNLNASGETYIFYAVSA